MTKHRLPLRTGNDKAKARAWLDRAPVGHGWRVEFLPPVRSSIASAYMWALLDDVAAQKDWPLNSGKRWPSDAWKDLFSASLRGQEMVPNLDNTGFVAFGSRTSEFSPEEMSDMIELIKAWGAQNDVQFTDQQALAGDGGERAGEASGGASGASSPARDISEVRS